MTMEIWAFALTLIGILIVGAVAGFFASRWFFKKELQKNPPINEKMIKALYQSMGRKPSESQIRSIMNNVKKNQ